MRKTNLKLSSVLSTFLVLTIATPSFAQSFFGRPNIETGTNPKSIVQGGQTFTNAGLVGAGRVLASSKDKFGDTLGSFSGMALDLSTWRKSGNGYSALLYTLPDRGYNDVSFSNYKGRISAFDLSFTPYTGTAILPVDTASQNQVNLTYNASKSFLLSDFNGNPTTGENPDTTIVQNGYTLPMITAPNEGAGRVSIDAEALVLRRDGTFYVGDEYTGGIYYFDATGKMKGFIAPVAATLPFLNGNINYNSLSDPTTGRRNNQGMESVSLTADSKYLFGVMQSATVQDSIASDQSTRLNTRVFVYDVSSNPAPTAPYAHYVLKLPTIDRDGVNGAADRTAAQSEILALNKTQFLMLTRDGNGLDNGDSRPIVFKSIYLVDVSNATNIAGTPFETSATPVAPGGILSPTVTAASSVQFVNMLNIDQLTKFGLNLDANPADLARTNNRLTISEKWEAMALAPTLEEAAPQDFFLFVGNDNDFQTRTGTMVGDLQYNTYDDGTENDSLLLVYRVSLPTYVDATYRLYLEETAPMFTKALGSSSNYLAKTLNNTIDQHLETNRLLFPTNENTRYSQVWGSLGSINGDNKFGFDINHTNYNIGLDWGLTKNLIIGAALGATDVKSKDSSLSFDYSSSQAGVYLDYLKANYFANISYNYSEIDFDNIKRMAGYGQTATGSTSGFGNSININSGKMFNTKYAMLGPILGVSATDTKLASYKDTGASGGNITFGENKTQNYEAYIGGKIIGNFHNIHSSFALTYNAVDSEIERQTAKLTSANNIMGLLEMNNLELDEDYINAKLNISTNYGKIALGLGYDAKIGQDSEKTSHNLSATIGYRF